MKYPRVLTIAGSDSGGGAGIQADIKTISACQCYAASAITAVTVQNTLGVQDVHPVPVGIIEQQIRCVLDDIGADAIKLGMLHSADVVRCVAHLLNIYKPLNVVLDPVMVSTSGHALLDAQAVEVLQRELLPLARIITPNLPEASMLLGHELSHTDQLPDAARQLGQAYQTSILLKGGHLEADRLVDVLYNHETHQMVELPSVRIDTRNTHGTGCTLSSALASFLARGYQLTDAAMAAKKYINEAIIAGARYEIGNGHGPVCHFYDLWKSQR